MAVIELSRQDAFNRIWAYYIVEKSPLGFENRKIIDGRDCVYRGSEGQRCPVGLLLSDEVYRPEYEGSSLAGNGELSRLFSAELLPLMNQMQSIHDATINAPTPAAARVHFESGLRRVAAFMDLRIPCPPR